jgi:thiazole synthase
MNDILNIGEFSFNSRLFTGTGKFGDLQIMEQCLAATGSELVTVALKRVDASKAKDPTLSHIPKGMQLLPNTSGVRTAKEAIFAAELAREALGTSLLKLEIHPDPKYLMPDPIETYIAAKELVKLGFTVLPYCGADPVLCKRLEDIGCAAVMPLGSAIGSNQGLQTQGMLEIIIQQSNIPVIVDAGIGAPSDAAKAMEMGASAVLVNTALAVCGDPVKMGLAFKKGVEAGREAFLARIPAKRKSEAIASSPLTQFLD